MTTLSIGLSTCPNDTFLFHALMEGDVRIEAAADVTLEFTLADVEELNRGLFEGRFDVCKVSAHAALVHAEHIVALPVGWALGYGVGPVVLGPSGRTTSDLAIREPPLVLCPGEWTTAHLLWKLFHPEPARVEQRVFSEIIPELMGGRADRGVCIHEGRFTWESKGLVLFEDLGETWERATETALPLGGIVAKRSLATELRAAVIDGLRRSLEWGHAHRRACLPTLRRLAQEASDDVLFAHVDLYVNEWTNELGTTGRDALSALAKLGRERGLLPEHATLDVAGVP